MSELSDFEGLAQAEFLRLAMGRLGMTRGQFAVRIAVTVRTLDDWMIPAGTKSSRKMPPMARKFILEILEKEGAFDGSTRKAGI